MTSSKSTASINSRWLESRSGEVHRAKARAMLVLLLLVCGLGGVAHAERKRVVVLPFEGDKAEKFYDGVVKLLKKSHTVVSSDKWDGAAEELSAAKVTGKNVKKVAKKLKIDGVVEGTVEKRRDQYIIRITLRAGTTGEVLKTTVNVKADGPRLDGDAQKDIKSELNDLIAGLDSNRAAGGDEDEKPTKKARDKANDEDEDEDAKPAKKKPGKDRELDEDEDAKPAKKKPAKDEAEDEDEPKKGGFTRGADKGDKKRPAKDEDAGVKKAAEDEDESPLPKPKKRPKDKPDADEDEVAAKGEAGDDEEIEDRTEPGPKMDQATALSPGNRAIDVVAGISFNARRLSWKTSADLPPSMGVAGTGKPPNYKGLPAPGVLIDITAYPLAFGHKNQGMLKNIGLHVMYDKVLLISSKAGGEKLETAQQRFGVGGVFRYPLGKTATAPVVGARLGYGNQKFQIAGAADIPNVNYTMIDIGAFFRYSMSEKIILNVNLGYLAFSNTGQIQKDDQYGAATVAGFEGELGADYAITKTIFARAALKFETIGFTFKGKGMLTTGRDGDPEPDVTGARDNYLGGAVTVGYLY